MTPSEESQSIGELLRDLASDSSELIRQEMALARAETQDKLHHAMAALVCVVAGALFALAALIVLADVLIYGLIEAGFERWLAALIVAGGEAAVAMLLVWKGQKDLAATRLTPARTAASVRKDINLVKEQVT